MAESMGEVSGPNNKRLKDYKQTSKEPEEVKNTRKLLEGINLRRNQREKEFARRRTLRTDKDNQSLEDDVDKVIEIDGDQGLLEIQPPLSQQGLLGEESVQTEDTEQEQHLDDSDESEWYGVVPDYESEDGKCLQQEMKQKAKLLHSEKECEVFEGMVYFRKYLRQDHPRHSYLRDVTIIPQLVQLLSCSKDRKLHVSLSYALMLIATGRCRGCIENIIEAGGVPVLMDFITLEKQEVAENALKVLAHIANEGTEARNSVLKHGMVPALMKFGEELDQVSKGCLEEMSGVIAIIFRFEFFNDVQEVLPLIGVLKEIVTISTESRVLHYVYCALSFMSESDGKHALIPAVVDSGICQILVPHIDGDHMSITHAMKAFANIASESDANIQFLLDLDILNLLKPLIKKYVFSKYDLMEEVFPLLSKILSGTQEQIQRVIDCDLMGPILDSLARGSCIVKRQCIWCVCNLLSRGNPDQRRYAVSQGCIAVLCDCIDDRLDILSAPIIAILEALQSLITDSCEPDAEYHMSLVEECGGLDQIKKAKDDHHHHVAELSCSIIDLFTRRKEQQ